MADSIILLEERKEVTTFLLDEGTITETTVTTPTGETPGYEYSGEKVTVDSAVTLSENSDIGKPTVKKNTLMSKMKLFWALLLTIQLP